MSIRGVRKRAGISQTALSKLSHVSREQINKYENRHMKPDLETLIKIKTALGCTLDELVEEDEGEISDGA